MSWSFGSPKGTKECLLRCLGGQGSLAPSYDKPEQETAREREIVKGVVSDLRRLILLIPDSNERCLYVGSYHVSGHDRFVTMFKFETDVIRL